MTRDEADRIMAEIAKRQTLDMFDDTAIRSIIAPHPFDAVVTACINVRKQSPFIDAPKLAEALEQTGDAWNDWQHIVTNIIDTGAMADYATRRQPIPAESFPNPQAQRAFRSAYQTIRTKPADQAWRAFRAAYQTTADTPAPALDVAQLPAIGRPLDQQAPPPADLRKHLT